jgi:hypothetical protein
MSSTEPAGLGDYLWPETLRQPTRPPKLIYLDLNHWVALAKAHAGHSEGRAFEGALEVCIQAVDRGAALFPISDTIYFETSKIGPFRQRKDLRDVIERVSRFMVVTSRSLISVHEIEELLNHKVGPNPQPINSMDYLDWGVARAFGLAGGFRVVTADGEDVTEWVRAAHPESAEAFNRELAEAELELNRKTLEGPSPEEEPEPRRLGWEPMSALGVTERRVQQEIDQVGRFNNNPKWRRGRIRDVVSAREVFIEINESLERGISQRGTTLEEAFRSPEEFRRGLNSMPSFDVAVTLKVAYHRDPNHRWTTNDVADIDALGSTLPYCDVVVTDKAVAANAKAAKLPERLNTVVLARLSEIADVLP